MSIRTTFEALADRLRTVSRLRGVSSILEWDQQVMMPSGAARARGDQLAALAGLVHEQATSPEVVGLFDKLALEMQATAAVPDVDGGESPLDAFERRSLQLGKKKLDRQIKLPKELVERSAALGAEAYDVWTKAREQSNFAMFAPYIRKWVDLRLEMAQHINPAADPYDVALDEFEPDMTRARLDELFTAVKAQLVPLVNRICDRAEARADEQRRLAALVNRPSPVDGQEKLSREVVAELGFPTERGRLDVSVHPFTIGSHPTDVRITTRFSPDEWLQGLTGTVHEFGHALYELGLPAKYEGLPVCEALSMGVHESQSLLWERHVGLSPEFWHRYWPRVVALVLGGGEEPAPASEAYRAVNRVERSFVRVEADELTYPLHVILRYEIEADLFDGKLSVDDLPAAWNAKMTEYLRITPPTDSKGCLQDVHWSGGAFGYFPTYLLGAMAAAQIFAAATRALPSLLRDIESGNFAPLREWLRDNVHARGSLLKQDELLRAVTGEPLTPKYFIEYLTAKYEALYPAAV